MTFDEGLSEIDASVAASRLRVPPHSAEAEQSLLGALLLDSQSMERIATLRSSHLYRYEHKTIFEAIASLVASGKDADVIDVHNALGGAHEVGGIAYLNALAQSVPSSRGIERYAEIIRSKAQLRALIEASDEAACNAFASHGGNVGELVEKAQAALSAISIGSVTKAPRSLASIAIERTQYYEDLQAGKASPGWPTGFPSLDAMLNGGLRPGGLYILAARPKVGKSSLALWIAERMAAQQLPTLVLSQEMPDVEVADRGVAMIGRIDYGSLMSGKMSSEDWSRTSDALDRMAELPIWIDDEPALGIGAIRAKARSVKGCKVLVVDYLQLCAGTKDDDNRNTQIEQITRGLKALAKSVGMAVIALSQLNREVDKRANGRPRLSDLRDSGAIEQDADAVLMLWVHQANESYASKIIGCAVEANRQGRTGTAALDFDGAHQRWGQSTVSLDEPKGNVRRSFE